MNLRALFYGRVSDARQVDGVSLDQQDAAAERWCREHFVTLAMRMREEGASARTSNRTTLRRALAYIRERAGTADAIDVFLIYDLSRFCRNVEDQLALKRELSGYGCRLDSITLQLQDTPEGRFAQTTIGASNQLVSEMQGKKIRECMLHRKHQGRWPHPAPLGYRNLRADSGGQKLVAPDPRTAPVLRAAFAAAARGERMKDILERATAQGLVGARAGKPLRMQELRKILSNPFYAGRIRSVRWGLDLPGEHEPLVDEETFALVQERFSGRGPMPTKVRDREEFPLRGFAVCDACGKPLTASLSRGKLGVRYGYYFCWNPACSGVRLAAGKLEDWFAEALEGLGIPESGTTALIVAHLVEIASATEAEIVSGRAAASRRLLDLRRKRDRMVEAYVYEMAVDRPTYEAHLQRLDGEIHSVNLELARTGGSAESIESLVERAKPLFTEPAALWNRANLNERRRLQALVFPAGIRVTKSALRTPATASIYSLLRSPEMPKGGNGGALSRGLEPFGGLEVLRAWVDEGASIVAAIAGQQVAWGRA